MRFQNLVLSLGGILAHAQSTLPEQCATGVHAILIRGQGPGDHLNVMVTIQNLILQVIPGSTSIALPYKHGLDDHRRAAADGAYLMQEYIREYIADCPNSKIFLHGYSLVSSLCLCSSWLYDVPALEPKYNESVIAAVCYGEETFLPLQPWNIGSCTNGTGLYPRIHPETCNPFKHSLRSYCDVGDVECCLTNPPGDNLAHFLYIVKYNLDVIHFIQRRLNETRSNKD
ncbi:uncharacterized protein N7469_000778 [Penicillium citrinum]|uniref:Uncharacterized protein n=1 Tax=Penicillium citrinum TaxID=5077 RepID=A0A9W9PDI5_PENCI|nr:uncharacterized protein N7469_000778 [Penicillium citrinum]KAJ5242451.1 hypothetical protein N7469_000778 [Penicillium citrinum]